MERELWPQNCAHTECGDGQRFDYCERQLAYSPEEVEAITDHIDALSRQSSTLSTDSEGAFDRQSLYHMRRFETDQMPDYDEQLFAARQGLTLSVETLRHPTRRRYDATVEWWLVSEDEISTPAVRIYTFEEYASGSQQCTVTEQTPSHDTNVHEVTFEDRPMTVYDLSHLAQTLHELDAHTEVAARQ